ncbi:type II secretion system protein GspM [Desulfobulbus oligotrophicus]|jgi:general secretion pathway protein M|uniref:Type 4a pilus biogenesis protein PilO n=1 Tax=Desulfobulbus oligotrophicus TaxID=1909699 RepID=A0A7T5VCF9_9BACT|nr:type II secretion system protein GspM [Desulfobulbus oligotrophicus]MDY0390897.1 type II secretion system protein GspM [Desulfobulbus oligotrophicus]QQG65329.1 type 4a pilus biogenesis protein PilO [Desulfobulbus oligotrophicus]
MKLQQLSRREQLAVYIAGGALVLFVVVQFLIFPLIDGRSTLQKRLQTREMAIVEMRELQQRYQRINRHSGSLSTLLEQREPGFSLFSFVEQKATDSGVKELITYMKPTESMEDKQFKQSQVEMRLQGVSLGKLVEFLEQVEAPKQLVGISKVAIQENGKELGTLDVTLHLMSVDQADGPSARE